MARLVLIVISMLVLCGSSMALVSEAVIASLVLLNSLLGTSNVELAVAAALGEASSLAGVIPTEIPASWTDAPVTDPTIAPETEMPTVDPLPNNGEENPVPVVDVPVAAAERRKRRRRQLPSLTEVFPNLDPGVGSTVPENEKTLGDLQEEIFENIGNIAHDMTSELSIHLGLKPHTLEAVLLHEEDAPSLTKVVESVAKRFRAPKLLIAGLHSLNEQTDYFEENYESDDDDVNHIPPPTTQSHNYNEDYY